MLTQLRDFLKANQWVDMALIPFFSMVDRRKSLHQEVIENTRANFPGLLATEVPYWSEIERMSVRRAPLPAYAPRSAAGQIYEALWKEVAMKLGQVPFLRARRAPAADAAKSAFAPHPSG
jgi:cellulose biosynthesis protein BcsQ